MITRPAAEWPVVAMEPATPAALYTSYIIPLAAITPICSFISTSIFLHNVIIGAVAAVLSFVLELVYVFLVALIAQALAPNFGGAPDRIAALKWVAYGYTPRWVAGVFALIPILGSLVVLVASLYSLYVIYLGTVPMMRVPQERATGYVLVLLACVIVLGIVVGVAIGAVVAAITLSTAVATGGLR